MRTVVLCALAELELGRLVGHERTAAVSHATGTALEGWVDGQLERRAIDEPALRGWLLRTCAARVSLRLHFSGEEPGPLAAG